MKQHFLTLLFLLIMIVAIAILVFGSRQDHCSPVEAQHLVC